MEGLNIKEMTQTKGFDYDVYVRYYNQNPEKANEYKESFNKQQVVSEAKTTTATQETKIEQVQASEEKNEGNVIENVVFSEADVKELRKVYKERHPEGKNAFGGWNGPELVKRINDLPSK